MKKKTKGKRMDVKAKQAFTNCVHGYDHACNLHVSGIARTRKFMYSIESANLSHRPLCLKKIKNNHYHSNFNFQHSSPEFLQS